MSAETAGEVAGPAAGSLRTLVRSIRTTGHDAGPMEGREARGGRPSAVLALISEGDLPDIVLTRRNAALKYHAGQVSLPGGRAEIGDRTLVETALREAHEEVGVDLEGVEVVGTMPTSHIAVSSADVTTVVASWDGTGPLGVVDPGEVASVRRVPMADLADPANRARTRHPSGFTGPAFLIPDLFIWGFTAQLLDRLLIWGGWSRPWKRSRTVEIPDDYLGGLHG